MSRLRILPIALLVLAGCNRITITGGGTITTSGKVMREKLESRTLKCDSAPHVVVEILSGTITVAAGDKEAVVVDVTKRGGGDTEEEAEAMLQKIKLEIDQTPDLKQVTVKASLPPGERFVGETLAKLKVPAGAKLELRATYGDVRVSGVNGPIEAGSSNGTVTVRDGGGKLKLTSTYGKIEVVGPASGVTATSSNGVIRVEGTKGPLRLHSTYGNIHSEAAGGEVEATTSSGQIEIRGASGRVNAKSTYGNVDIAGDEVIVTAETSNGLVKFVGTLADGEHEFRTTYGDIAVTLPADTQFRFDARTTYGSIKTGFQLTAKDATSRQQLSGTVGAKPTARLKLSTSSGNIRIDPRK
jgi:DUF4097 and DUF4098 domain-containing protein YvlB